MDSGRSSTPTALAQVLGDWSHGPGALYRRLATAIRDAIVEGDLAPETVLPPERNLAKALAVSRSTVVKAYELLKEDGLLEARQGSGTWVSGHREGDGDSSGLAASAVFGGLGARASTTGVIEFTVSAVAADPEVRAATARVCGDGPSGLDPLLSGHGYFPSGVPELREAVAQRYRDLGVTTDAEELLVTSGAQQAMALIVRLFLRPGDTAIVESPTYPGALDVLRAAGVRLQSLPLGPDGPDVALLGDLIARTSPRLVYLMTTFNNPTGSLTPDAKRREIARLAARHRVAVVDDRSLANLALTDEPLPQPLAAFGAEGPILTIGSTSKTYWGGLRVGWIRAPESVIARLARTKAVDDLGTSVMSQLIAADLIRHADDVVERRRDELRPRRDALLEVLDDQLPDWSWFEPQGGLSLWVGLPTPTVESFAEVAARHGVAFVTGPVLSPDEGNRDHLRLHFVHDVDTIREGVRRLARAWDEHRRTGGIRSHTARLLV